MNNSPAILPCPFCGSVTTWQEHLADDLPCWLLCCVICGASTGGAWRKKDDAIAFWNRRAIIDHEQEKQQ